MNYYNEQNTEQNNQATVTSEQLPSEQIAERLQVIHVEGFLDQLAELQAELGRKAWDLGADYVCAMRVETLKESVTRLVSSRVPNGPGGSGGMRTVVEEVDSPLILVYGTAVKSVARAAAEQHADDVNILTLWDDNAVSKKEAFGLTAN